MDLELVRQFVDQSLLMAMTYAYTDRYRKAYDLMLQVKKIDLDNPVVDDVFNYINTQSFILPNISEFIGDWWHGDRSVCGKSIQVVCDQGMGDTINGLRYLKMLKDERPDCEIIVNCYAYYSEFKRLFEMQSYIDDFTKFHKKCDYYTNILSIPILMGGNSWKNTYPISFNEILEKPIPPQPYLGEFKSSIRNDGGFKIGLAWHSNMDNPLGVRKSISLNKFAILEDGVNQIFSLLPTDESVNFVIKLPIDDLYDTASIIAGCDVVISVDTAVLHLAGAMGKKTFGLLPFEADARWGWRDDCVWYPSVELFRQGPDRDWEKAINRIKQTLVEFRNICYH